MRKTIKKTSLAMLAVSAIACVGLGSAAIKTVTPASATTTSKDIFMAYGASVRLADDFNGLRFKMAVTADYYASNSAGKYGMIIIPYEYITLYADELEENGKDYVTTFAEEGVQVLNFTDMEGYAADENCNATTGTATYQCFNGIISSIKYDNLNKDFVAIGYYNDGTTYNYASFNEEDNVRNVVEVANAALKENAVATTDIYSTEQVLRLYEYVFLNDQKAEQALEEEAKESYADYKEGLLTKYTSESTWMTLGQKQNIEQMKSGDVLTLEFDILESDLGATVKCTGLVIGPNVFGVLNPYSSKSYAVSWLTTWINNFNDGTIRLYSVDAIEYTGTRDDTSYMGLNSLTGGKSLKYEYRPYISENEKGSVTIYWKDVEDEEWTKVGSVEGIKPELAPSANVGIAFSGAGINSLAIDNFTVSYNDEILETATKSVDECKGNMVTVESDGVVLDAAFVPVGKAYTPDESLRIEDLTLNGEPYNQSPIMTNITLEGTVAMPEFYNVSINTTGPDCVWFSNDIALEKGRDITFEYTVRKVQYTGNVSNGFHALGSDDTKSLSYSYMASKFDLGANVSAPDTKVLPQGDSQDLKIKIVFKYDEATGKYNLEIYHDNELNYSTNSAIEYNEYFGMTLLRFLVSIELEDVKCYDSTGTNLGVSGDVMDNVGTITITPNNN